MNQPFSNMKIENKKEINCSIMMHDKNVKFLINMHTCTLGFQTEFMLGKTSGNALFSILQLSQTVELLTWCKSWCPGWWGPGTVRTAWHTPVVVWEIGWWLSLPWTSAGLSEAHVDLLTPGEGSLARTTCPLRTEGESDCWPWLLLM